MGDGLVWGPVVDPVEGRIEWLACCAFSSTRQFDCDALWLSGGWQHGCIADDVVDGGLVWCPIVDPVGCRFADGCGFIVWSIKWVNVAVWWVDAVDCGRGFRALLVVS